MKKLLYILSLIFIFSSCQSFKPYTDYKTTKFSVPSLNEEITAFVGDALISQGIYDTGLAVYIPTDCLNGDVKKGLYYANSYSETSTLSKEKKRVYKFKGNGIVEKEGLGRPYMPWLQYNEFENKLMLMSDNGYLGTIDEFEIRQNAIKVSSSSFQQTLIYLGKSSSVLKFGYRESLENLTRPAFSNEITYADIIGYKKAKLQVISATNTSITYKVLSYFDDSESLF